MSGIKVEGVGADYGREEGVSGAPLNVHSNGYVNALQVKPGPGTLYGFTVYNSKVSAQFIQIHDKNVAPASGDVPAVVFTAATIANLAANWIPGRSFLYGCWIVNSSTGPTYTAGSADCFIDAQYV